MKIFIIVDDYMPDSIKIAAKMMHDLACQFIKEGHYVTVLTPNPKQSQKCIVSNLDGVNLITFKSGKIKNVNKVIRAINESLLSFNAWHNCKDILQKERYNLIIYYSPTIFFGPLVKKLKKEWNAKTYLILRDIFPQWAIDNNILKKHSLITKYFQFFEKINYDAADTIGLMSPKNLEWFQSNYSFKSDKKLEVLYNWTDTKVAIKKENKYRDILRLKDKVVYFYGGNIGRAQDMMNIVRLANNMKDDNKTHFLLVGAGDEYELIESKIKYMKNITLLPPVNQEEYKQMLSEFDVGLFTLSKNHITHNFPGKLLGYMAYGLPILGSINHGNDLKGLIEKYNAGLISINGDDDLFYKNAKELFIEEKREEIASNAFKLLNDIFSVNSATKQILSKNLYHS